jgi:hypothetical protein
LLANIDVYIFAESIKINFMDSLLDRLYKEFKELHEKQKVIAETIKAYGGTIPSFPAHQHSEVILEAAFEDFAAYPSSGTWQEKIEFALKELGKPSTVGTITELIKKYEPKTDIGKIFNALTQTCSSLAGARLIGAEKGYRNKYYIIKE